MNCLATEESGAALRVAANCNHANANSKSID